MKNLSQSSLDQDLGFNLHRVSQLFRRELTRCLSEHSMTPEQWQALVYLSEKESCNQNEIATITQQDAPTISRTIKYMQQNGWVEKTQDMQDRRACIVKISQNGKKLKKKIVPKLDLYYQTLLRKFTDKKNEDLKSLIIDLRIALNDLEEN